MLTECYGKGGPQKDQKVIVLNLGFFYHNMEMVTL